jgi:hypothetical protein
MPADLMLHVPAAEALLGLWLTALGSGLAGSAITALVLRRPKPTHPARAGGAVRLSGPHSGDRWPVLNQQHRTRAGVHR